MTDSDLRLACADDSGTGGSLEVSVKQEVMEQPVEDEDEEEDDEDALKMDTSQPIENVQEEKEEPTVEPAAKAAVMTEPQESRAKTQSSPPPPSVVEPVVVIKTEPGLVVTESSTIRPWSNGVIFSHRRATAAP